jgi:SAM-dependent methyltransferase
MKNRPEAATDSVRRFSVDDAVISDHQSLIWSRYQMDDLESLWTGKWSIIRFEPPLQDFYGAVKKLSEERNFQLFGSDQEPRSSIRNSAFAEAMGEHFLEGMSILDYGCGAGRYAQFLRQRLRSFEYYGLEKSGSKFHHGEKSIQAGRELFEGDERIKFGLIDSPLEGRAIDRASVAILASVFTHVDHEEMTLILTKLKPIIARNGAIVFSIFIADEYNLERIEIYGMQNAYNRVWYTIEQITTLCDAHSWQLTEKERYVAVDGNVHRIFAITHPQPPTA